MLSLPRATPWLEPFREWKRMVIFKVWNRQPSCVDSNQRSKSPLMAVQSRLLASWLFCLYTCLETRSHCLPLAGLELSEICLPCAGIKGLQHHARSCCSILNLSSLFLKVPCVPLTFEGHLELHTCLFCVCVHTYHNTQRSEDNW